MSRVQVIASVSAHQRNPGFLAAGQCGRIACFRPLNADPGQSGTDPRATVCWAPQAKSQAGTGRQTGKQQTVLKQSANIRCSERTATTPCPSRPASRFSPKQV